MAQLLVPVSDQATGSWTNAPLWSKADADDDTDAVSEAVGNNTDTSNADLKLASGDNPQAGTQTLRVRWHHDQSGRTMQGTCELYEGDPAAGGTLITTLQSATDVGTTEAEDSTTVTGISDYTALYVRLRGRGTGGGPSRSLHVDLVELSIPDAGASPVTIQASAAPLTVAAQTVSVVVAVLAITASPAAATVSAQTVSPQPAATVVEASPATLNVAAQAVNPTFAALVVEASPASLTVAAQTVSPQAGENPVVVTASPAAATVTAQSVTPTAASTTVEATPTAVVVEARPVSPQQAALVLQATPAGVTVAAQVVVPQVAGESQSNLLLLGVK